MRWGLLPSWHRRDDMSLPVVNTKSVVEKSSSLWFTLRATRRCAVVCQGSVVCYISLPRLIYRNRFFVWRKMGKGNKTVPHYLKHPDSHLVVLAGLYDSARVEGRTCWPREPRTVAYASDRSSYPFVHGPGLWLQGPHDPCGFVKFRGSCLLAGHKLAAMG